MRLEERGRQEEARGRAVAGGRSAGGSCCVAENREIEDEDVRPELTRYMYCLIRQTESTESYYG
jgi:hypothetical protein